MSTAVTPRIKGIFQVLRARDNWTISPVVYNSGVSYQPLTMTSKEAIELFSACQLPKASLAQESFIIEFETPVTTELLSNFGFTSLVRK
jgi:hypothetical protein